MIHLRERAWWMRYGVAVLSVALAAAGVALVEQTTAVAPFLLFALAASVSTTYGGVGPGLLAVLLACITSDFLFLPPLYTLVLDGRTLYLGVVYLLGGLVSYAAWYRLRARAHPGPAGEMTVRLPGWRGGRPERNGRRGY